MPVYMYRYMHTAVHTYTYRQESQVYVCTHPQIYPGNIQKTDT